MINVQWIEPHIRVGVLRGRTDNKEIWKNGYHYVCTILVENNTAEIVAMKDEHGVNLMPGQIKEVLAYLHEKGIKKIIYDRLKKGKLLRREYILKEISHLWTSRIF